MRARETRKLGVTVELLQLGKHIEPSGWRIHQHAERQSAAPEGSPPFSYYTTICVRERKRSGE